MIPEILLIGIMNITFALYDAETSGIALWSEHKLWISQMDFFSSVRNLTPLSPNEFSDSERWIGITIDADSEMTPRTKLGSCSLLFHRWWLGKKWEWFTFNNGKVGIGTDTPDEKLAVVGKIRASNDADETEYIEISHGGSHSYINWEGDGNLDFRYQNSTLATVKQSGDFNIPFTQGYQIGDDTVFT